MVVGYQVAFNHAKVDMKQGSYGANVDYRTLTIPPRNHTAFAYPASTGVWTNQFNHTESNLLVSSSPFKTNSFTAFGDTSLTKQGTDPAAPVASDPRTLKDTFGVLSNNYKATGEEMIYLLAVANYKASTNGITYYAD